jgi:predicted  nucleic acid-binding Zn-ribbon protein
VSEPVTNELIFSVLQKVQADMSELKFDMRDLKIRMTAAEEHVGSLVIAVSGTNNRLDRLTDRIDRIEHRLDLTDSH